MDKKILGLGGEVAGDTIAQLFQGEDVDVWLASVKPTAKQKREMYHEIVSVMSFSKVKYWELPKLVKSLHNLLYPGGNLHVFVPSLEFVLELLQMDNMPPIAQAHLYGLKGDERFGAYTILDIRQLLSGSGFEIINARVMSYKVGEYDAKMNYVQGFKNPKVVTDEK